MNFPTCLLSRPLLTHHALRRPSRRGNRALRALAVVSALLFTVWGASARASSVIPPTFAELVNESDYIVRAKVKSISSEWKEHGGHRNIFTHVELEVLEVIHGTPPQPLVLEMLGGKVGGEEMVVQGMPQFAVGQEDILFIRGNGRQFYPLTAAMHGRYPVVREATGRAHVNRSNQQPLRATADVALPMGDPDATEAKLPATAVEAALTAESFIQQIKAAVNPSHRRVAPQK